MQAQATNVITLRGSTDIVVQFFEDAVNCILYQRGIYPPETFKRVSKYGLSMMVTADTVLEGYITNVMKQLDNWLMIGSVQKLVLVVKSTETGETQERWVFDCEATSPRPDQNSRCIASTSINNPLLTFYLILSLSSPNANFAPKEYFANLIRNKNLFQLCQ